MNWDKLKTYLVNTLIFEGPVLEDDEAMYVRQCKLESIRLHIIYWCLLGLSNFYNLKSEDKINNDINKLLSDDEYVRTMSLAPVFLLNDKRSSSSYRNQIIHWILQCQNDDYGFGSCPGVHSQLTSTMYALHSLSLLGVDIKTFSSIQPDQVANWIMSTQNEDGSFDGEAPGDVDARYSLCACLAMKLLGQFSRLEIIKASNWLLRCQNADGGFGSIPGAESHGAYCFVAYQALKLLGQNESIPSSRRLEWFLRDRLDFSTKPLVTINGRSGKETDICYSWWVLGTLRSLKGDMALTMEQKRRVMKLISTCQDPSSETSLLFVLFSMWGLTINLVISWWS